MDAAPDLSARLVGDDDAIVECRACERHKREHVSGSNTGVNASMIAKINEFSGLSDTLNGGFHDGGGFARERDHAAVVVGVGFETEKNHSRDGSDGAGYGCNHPGISPLRK